MAVNTLQDPPQGSNPPRRPAGGYQPVSVVAIALAWWAYRRRSIRLGDLRVWFAAHEMLARRCLAPQNSPRRFGLDELQNLTGMSARTLRESLHRLEAARLMQWSAAAITPATSAVCLPATDREHFSAFLDQIPNTARQIPMPRRTLRWLCRESRPAMIAAILGHLLRCLYLRQSGCEPRGRVKASWIAQTFGVSLRRVKQARHDLVAAGWLIPLDANQWALNRWGAHVQVNLAWPGLAATPSANCRRSQRPLPLCAPAAPLPATSRPGAAPPESDAGSPSGRDKNQEPGSARPAGAFASRPDPEPAARPRLSHLVPLDLRDTGRLLDLFSQAVSARILTASDRDRLRFVAAAQHAHQVGTQNPCGLFAKLIRSRLWHFATQAEEDAASARLHRHLFGQGLVGARPTTLPARPVEWLSDDARLVRAVRHSVAGAGYRGDAFPLFRRQRPDWNRERWDRALAELHPRPAPGGASGSF